MDFQKQVKEDRIEMERESFGDGLRPRANVCYELQGLMSYNYWEMGGILGWGGGEI